MSNLLQISYLYKTNFIVAIKSLALLATGNRLVTRNTMTERLGIDSSYIRKILAKLMPENVVEGFGGHCGGYKLVVNPKEITLYDIYVASTFKGGIS
ncbi:Rrf2 family transcriptional regulator [Lysinibacillus xylanilyticus]|uniref:Rrf2 family transcriptional regulator n=1 Tax=Lysinibacillus xylanilyticus TaxID=582475 RepID=UPI0038230D94